MVYDSILGDTVTKSGDYHIITRTEGFLLTLCMVVYYINVIDFIH